MIEVNAFSFSELTERFIELLFAPVNNTEMLWIAIPLVLTLFLTEIYFSRYKAEELGWNSAYGNALVLLFVSVDIFRYLFNHNLLENLSIKLAIGITVAALAVLLTLINFMHILPEQFAYGLSSKLPMNFIAYMSLILIYSEIPVDLLSIVASLGLLLLFVALILILRSLIPSTIDEVSY